MELHVLGPLQVLEQGRALALGAVKQQVVLAVLLLHPNEVVSPARLVDEVWGESPPATAPKVLQGYISSLRRILGSGAIITRGGGYQAVVPAGALDSVQFDRLAGAGRAAAARGDPVRAADLFARALALWRGEALAGLEFRASAAGEVERLAEQRLSVAEQLTEVELTLGRHIELVPRLRELVAAHPYRERLRAQLMLALYRSGRQAEALAVIRDTRRLLADELGIDPGPELRRLESRMLAHAPELDPPPTTWGPHEPTPAPDPEPAPEPSSRPAPPLLPVPSAASAPFPEPGTRRLVTVLSAELAAEPPGGLDPEALHHLLDVFARACEEAAARHGGTVERAGQAATGVFGLRELREDDAAGAVRAAVALRDALSGRLAAVARDHDVVLRLRTAVESGEVYVAPDEPSPAGVPPRAAGQVFEVAALLRQAAPPDAVLLGDRARRLLGPAARVEPYPAAGGERAWLLGALDAEPPPLASFVGRHDELHRLRTALEQASGRRACHLVTVLGPPGIGKSRLAAQLRDELPPDVTVVTVRCGAYGAGEGPLAQLTAALIGDARTSAGDAHDPAGDDAPARHTDDPTREAEDETGVAEGLAGWLLGETQAGLVRRRLLAALGLSGEPAQADETFWAVRRMLAHAARRRPLLAVLDDLHRAQPELLDLLDYLVACGGGAPVLLLCLARPELTEDHPAWAAPHPGKAVLALGPLPDAEAAKLAEMVARGPLGPAATREILAAAEGNPFFVEQLVAARAESPEARLPLTVQAVLAARLDRLPPGERAVLRHGSVEGPAFHRGALAALLPPAVRPELGTHLVSLVRKGLIRAERPEFADEDAFRFAHALIGEVACASLPKATRAGLHERLAAWLKGKPAAHPAAIGHHLETGLRLRAELGPPGERERALADEAAAYLAEAAPAALLRGDVAAARASRLWERAAALMRPGDPARTAILPRVGAALHEAGRFAAAARVLEEAAGTAADPRVRALAEVERERLRLQTGAGRVLGEARRVAGRALSALDGDDRALCRAWCLRASIAWTEGRAAAADDAWRQAGRHARRAGDDREHHEILGWRASAAAFGPTPVPEGLARCARSLAVVAGNPAATAVVLHPYALLQAMHGDLAQARESVRRANEILGDLGRLQSAVSHHEAMVELLAGCPGAAEPGLRAGCDRLAELGERTLLATTAAMLARALLEQGREEEAELACRLSEEHAGAEDVPTQVMWRGVQARLLAAGGQPGGESLARQAVRLAGTTDLLPFVAAARLDLAEVLDAAGRHREAREEARRALAGYERKGDVVSAGRVRSRLAALGRGH
ncbi:BTAD domain-containing putative transcriptional regulator [Actinomadura luzonensis]|uniref:BTAD domain-containing putative transcriptional regulator n=1 Tax=Actinomadura luzonensis TaxID=2805427 RepID=UPI002675767D|nr:BTAD domain-containing putative transcriptional regulator [Actinomadura luzonensis]